VRQQTGHPVEALASFVLRSKSMQGLAGLSAPTVDPQVLAKELAAITTRISGLILSAIVAEL
jgi:hypothetical protein